MKTRTRTKMGLALLLALAAALPTRAGTTNVNSFDGVNFDYTATDTNGVLVVTFVNPTNYVTKVNGTGLSLTNAIPSAFAQLTLSPTLLTTTVPGISGFFTPNVNETQFGLTSLSPPSSPNVVFDYTISFGTASANSLSLAGALALDPASATTVTQNGTTYDFSDFTNFSNFTLSLGTQSSSDPTAIYDILSSGNGTFSGTGQFDAAAAVIPEPTSIVLVGVCGMAVVAMRRRKE
jgi:hypothetical protein